jgi:DNA invertase Pin-like site-specific DNA recombinase
MKTAIIYCRVSSDKQAQQWDSLDIQEKDCRAYCERNSIDVIGVFREQYTGTLIERPALSEALQFLKKNKWWVSYCIIHKLDRSTRGGVWDYHTIKQKIEVCGTTLKDAFGIIGEEINMVNIENIDTSEYDWARSNPSDMAVNMMIIHAEQERKAILQRTIPQEIRNSQEWYISRPAHFGYQNTKICTSEGKLKVVYSHDPIESKYIKIMFDMRAKWIFSDQEIVTQVNLAGYKSRLSKKWNLEKTIVVWFKGGKQLNVKQLQGYIKNPVYAWIIQEKWTNHQPIRGKFPWIVSIETFNQANRGVCEILEHSDGNISILYGHEKLPDRIIHRRFRFQTEYPFARAMRCPQCAWHLTANRARSGNGSHHCYYQCTGKKWSKHKTYTVRRDNMHETMSDFISRLKFDKKAFDLFKRVVAEVWNERKNEIKSEKKDHLEMLRKTEEAKTKLIRNIEKILDFPELLKAKNEELKGLNNKIESLKNSKISGECEKNQDDFLTFSKNIFKHINKLLQDEKSEEKTSVFFDLIFEEPPTYEKILSNRPPLYPIFALGSKKEALDDLSFCTHSDWNTWWQLRRESNPDRRIWSP